MDIFPYSVDYNLNYTGFKSISFILVLLMRTTTLYYLLSLILLFYSGCTSSSELTQLQNEVNILKKQLHEIRNDQTYSILFIGDILLVNHSRKIIQRKGIIYPFEKIKDDLKSFDYVIANLETPISQRGIPIRNRYYVFQLHPKLAKSITTINLDAVTLGNNHLFDFGPQGLNDTIKYLDHWKIMHSGAGANISEARKPITIKHGDINIYIFSYCERPPDKYHATKDQAGTAPMDMAMIIEDIETYKKRNNLVFVSLHWGIEQTHMPQKDQIARAHEIIDAGADGVIGHHPHWPQAIEVYRDKPIIYSLGNFVNGHYNKIEKDNIITVFYCKQTKIKEIEIMSIAGKNRETKFQPFILKGKEARVNLMLIKNLSKYFKTDIEIFGYKGNIKLSN